MEKSIDISVDHVLDYEQAKQRCTDFIFEHGRPNNKALYDLLLYDLERKEDYEKCF